MIIVFDAVPVIVVFLCILTVFVDSASGLLLKVLFPLCVIMIIRSIYANLKRINSGGFGLRLCNIAIDVVRDILFYKLIFEFGRAAWSNGIVSFIDYVLVIIIGGFLFLLAELLSIIGALWVKNENIDQSKLTKGFGICVLANFEFTLLFGLFALWGLYGG